MAENKPENKPENKIDHYDLCCSESKTNIKRDGPRIIWFHLWGEGRYEYSEGHFYQVTAGESTNSCCDRFMGHKQITYMSSGISRGLSTISAIRNDILDALTFFEIAKKNYEDNTENEDENEYYNYNKVYVYSCWADKNDGDFRFSGPTDICSNTTMYVLKDDDLKLVQGDDLLKER